MTDLVSSTTNLHIGTLNNTIIYYIFRMTGQPSPYSIKKWIKIFFHSLQHISRNRSVQMFDIISPRSFTFFINHEKFVI